MSESALAPEDRALSHSLDKQGMEYDFEYLDFSYADEGKAKLKARGDAGWTVAGSTLAYPYAFILWQRGGSGPADSASDHGGSSAMSPGA